MNHNYKYHAEFQGRTFKGTKDDKTTNMFKIILANDHKSVENFIKKTYYAVSNLLIRWAGYNDEPKEDVDREYIIVKCVDET
jgi:hypothetical protein